jgi:hypothetical protein
LVKAVFLGIARQITERSARFKSGVAIHRRVTLEQGLVSSSAKSGAGQQLCKIKPNMSENLREQYTQRGNNAPFGRNQGLIRHAKWRSPCEVLLGSIE